MALFLFNIAYSLSVAISILFLSFAEQAVGKISISKLIPLVINIWFLMGLIFAFASRILFVVIIQRAAAYPLWATAPVSITTLVTFLSVVFVLLANYFFLGETLHLRQFIGGGIIFLGIWFLTAAH